MMLLQVSVGGGDHGIESIASVYILNTGVEVGDLTKYEWVAHWTEITGEKRREAGEVLHRPGDGAFKLVEKVARSIDHERGG